MLKKLHLYLIYLFGLIIILQLFGCAAPAVKENLIPTLQKPLETLPPSQKAYKTAFSLYSQQSYNQAAQKLMEIIEFYPFSEILNKTQFTLAMCYLNLQSYEEAIDEFQMYIQNFPNDGKIPEANLNIEYCQWCLTQQFKTIDPLLPSPQIPAEPEKIKTKTEKIHAAQVLLFGCDTYTDLEKTIADMQEAGVDTLIVRMFQLRGDRKYRFSNGKEKLGVYFNTIQAPVVEDVLSKLVEICHSRNMKIFAWLTTRYCDWKLEENPELCEYTYDLKTKTVVPAKGLNIFNGEVKEHLKSLYKDLARYDIDGILFQDDLILKHTEGYSQEAKQQYLKETGQVLNPQDMYRGIYCNKEGKYRVLNYTSKFWNWVNWKNKKILDLTQEIMNTAREVNPDLKFALNLYYENATNPRGALAWFSQNLVEAQNYNFDYYSIMGYHRQIQKELKLSTPATFELLSEMTENLTRLVENPNKILMKVQIIDWDTAHPIPAKEIDSVFKAITQGGKVSLGYIRSIQEAPLQIIKKYYN